MSGLTAEDVESWIILDCNNSITSFSNYYYRIAAVIPDEIIALLLSKQRPDVSYYGSTLRITKTLDNNSSFTLGFYYVIPIDGKYIITRTNYPLLNYSVDYQPFLNSSDFIKLDITADNLDLSVNLFIEASKAEGRFSLTAISKYSEAEWEGRSIQFVGNKAYQFSVYNFGGTAFPTSIPTDVWTAFSTTPSILALAKQIFSFVPTIAAKAIALKKSHPRLKRKMHLGA